MRALFGFMRGRKITLGALALAGLLGGFYLGTAIGQAEAIAGPAVCTYYKDATKRKVIGARGTGCCGSTINWGTTSLYFTCEQLLCPDVVCPD